MFRHPLQQQRGAGTTPPSGFLIGLIFLIYLSSIVTATGRIVFMDHSINSSLVLSQTTFNFSSKSFRIAFSFLTCSEGQILYQRGNSGDFIKLFLQNSTLFFTWKSGVMERTIPVANHLQRNSWYFLDIFEHTGDIKLHLQESGVLVTNIIIANSTYRASIFRLNLIGSSGLEFGGTSFTGCMMQGPNVLFVNNPHIIESHVLWNDTDCPLTSSECTASSDINNCWSQPCLHGGTCYNIDNDNYNCTCPHLYNGTNCENDLSVYGCTVSPCLNGGTCLSEQSGSKNYRCGCVLGFQGTNCETSINECASAPCKHGRCIDEVNNYSCNCAGTGFTGQTCDDDIDECNTGTSICGIGTCFNNDGSFTCSCPTGFDGPQCQNNINDCNSSPCKNGGSCTDGVASYQCTCPIGFEGDNCQNRTDDCKGVVCPEPNTTCVDGDNSYSCECKPGFTGSPGSCTDIDECISNPCRHGATCENLENKFNCTCKAGYQGNLCQLNINECASSPCQNGASCVDMVNGYKCFCIPGYTGQDCEININECALNNQPCRNGATCLDQVNKYTCQCSGGWTGQHCETDINECSSSPCQNGAACWDYINYYNCSCIPGYSGKNCQTNIDDCSPNPCQYGSTCIDLVNGYRCNCSDGWMGKNCSEQYDACSFMPCKNNATCSTVKPQKEYICACVLGYTGQNCQVNINDCKPDSCAPPFDCFDLVNNFTCACPTGYTGINCSAEINECASNPCLNGGSCIDHIGYYTCQCKQKFLNLTRYGNGQKLEFLTGFNGTNCENDIDECNLSPSICLFNGTCTRRSNGDYACQCGPDDTGIYNTGKNCEITTSYCISSEEAKTDPPACWNGGTCISGDGTFSCGCAPGYTGRRCKEEINECESSPCQNNGNCTDLVNRYTCDCIPGITGPNCEIDINECESSPCQNGGQCNDRINGYDCNCTDTGFNGTECQYNIDDCAILTPCQNNASCSDLIKDYACNCFPGYTGKDCEVDIDECMSNPCQYNGTCIQRSIKGQPDFSYFTAAGYDCSCIPGIKGVNCETNINECINNTCQYGSTCVDNINFYTCTCAPGYRGDRCQTEINECDEYLPCRNGATCKDKIADYDCMCPEYFNGRQYGGKNCTVELTGCQNNDKCKNGATCKPYLVMEDLHDPQKYKCICQHGFTGEFCDVSTTMSFNNDSYIKHTLSNLVNNTISIRFRTTLSRGIIFAWEGNFVSSTLFCTLELFNGMLYVTYPSGHGNDAVTKEYIFPYLLNDANWHEVELVQTSMLSFELKSTKCVGNCSLVVSYTKGAPKNNTWIGRLTNNFQTSKTVSQSNWIGCMEDIQINQDVLTYDELNSQTTNSVNVVGGCARSEQCFPTSCNRRGTCVDLWNKYRCDCDRPYFGTDCEKNFTAATFAKGTSTSWTSFDITSLASGLTTHLDISFFLRTRESSGLVMFLGNQGTSYITLELYQGYVLSRVILCNYRKAFYLNQTLFNNGEQHLVRVQLKNKAYVLSVGKLEVLHTISDTNSCNLNASNLYFGGKFPASLNSGRKKRETDSTINVEQITDLSAVGNFKGTIQDIELNSQKLLFYSEDGVPDNYLIANDTNSLQQGEVTDDVCSSHPCENSGTCSNVFFNDFSCICPHGFIGKNCSELDFCKDQSCPSGAECRTLSDGFECVSIATFSGKTNTPTFIEYNTTVDKSYQINNISLHLRTIVRNGHIMYIKDRTNHFVRIGLVGGNVVVMFKLDNHAAQTLKGDQFVNDRSWYAIELKQTDKTLKLTVSGTSSTTNSTVLSADAISLNTLINGESSDPLINLGFTSSDSSLAHHFYSGCLQEVRIGGLLLPFYKQDAFSNFTTAEYFFIKTHVNVQEGCMGGNGCSYRQCKHGTCLPDYYGYQCNCTGSGYSGDWCQTNVNDCEENVCTGNHGKCVDKVNDFYCSCKDGYTGNRCETSADACTSNPCQHNGSCNQANGGFTCDCTATGYVGTVCDVMANSTCLQSPCRNGGTCQDQTNNTPSFSCDCQTGYTGVVCETTIDYCQDLPCENGGNCTSSSTDYQCFCPPGFSGKNCSVNVDNCNPGLCKNGGSCIDITNDYICNCTDGWKGSRCDQDFDECETQPCQMGGTCQNTPGSFTCLCDNTGYQGQYCDVDENECLASPCQNQGTCFNYDGGYNCTCALGFEGDNCENPNCDLVSCENSGTCVTNLTNWNCICEKYYFGELCEKSGPCVGNPCSNNTKDCVQEDKENGSYTCLCIKGWEGVRCDNDINECTQGICQNSATCSNSLGDYSCFCSPGYTDKNCSTDIDDCARSPCKNGGLCTDQVNDFYCDCNNTGYTNKTCSDDVDECALDDSCINKVSCENTDGSYICTCQPGYTGTTCATKDPDYQLISGENDIMWYIIGPVLAVILIAIVIVIIVFVMCARSKRATRGTYSPSRQEISGSRVELGQVLKPPPEERLI